MSDCISHPAGFLGFSKSTCTVFVIDFGLPSVPRVVAEPNAFAPYPASALQQWDCQSVSCH